MEESNNVEHYFALDGENSLLLQKEEVIKLPSKMKVMYTFSLSKNH